MVVLTVGTAVSGLLVYQLILASLTSVHPLRIFHAGSLAQPFKEIEKLFENRYDFDVQLGSYGSVVAVRQVTEFNKAGDIVAVSDYSLIPKMMIPKHADWYIEFARNEMVLAYTSKSRHAEEIDENNWYEILKRSDVRFGFGNPNTDPCGYRTLAVIQLAELHYEDTTIFEGLISANTEIEARYENGSYSIRIPRTNLGPSVDKVEIGGKAEDTIAKLMVGSIDFSFQYRSVAVQNGLNFVDLPAEIDLDSKEHENEYKRVEVLVGGKTFVAEPIVYGITIPKGAKKKEGAVEFVKFLIGEEGRRVLEDCGHPTISPAIASNIDRLPKELQPLVIS